MRQWSEAVTSCSFLRGLVAPVHLHLLLSHMAPFPGEKTLLLFTQWSHLLGKHREAQLGFIPARFHQDSIQAKMSRPHSKHVQVLTPASYSTNARKGKHGPFSFRVEKLAEASSFLFSTKLNWVPPCAKMTANEDNAGESKWEEGDLGLRSLSFIENEGKDKWWT